MFITPQMWRRENLVGQRRKFYVAAVATGIIVGAALGRFTAGSLPTWGQLLLGATLALVVSMLLLGFFERFLK